MHRFLSACLCLFVVILITSACSHERAAHSGADTLVTRIDTAAYVFKTLRDQDTSKKDKQGDYSYADLDYPVFKTLPGLNKYLQPFKDEYANYTIDRSDSTDIEDFRASTYDSNISVSFNRANLLVLTATEEESGGAHPNRRTTFINWNSATDKAITLDDILVNNYQPKFTKIAEKQFRKDAGLSPNAELTDYHFENDGFALNNNFEITEKGISFYYNSYEIQAYAFGPTTLLIPYQSFKHLLRPNTVVSQFIK